MLRFFTMAMRLFAVCMIPGLLIILPINVYSTSESRPTDQDDDIEDDDPSLPGSNPRPGTSFLYLFTQFTFTWVFSLLTIYSIWRTYEGYISIRRRYMVKRRKVIVNRTIMVVGLPGHLQSDRSLATFYESLGVGRVESAHVCRHVTTLKRLIGLRANALRALEVVYTEYYGNPSGRSDYDPDAIAAANDHSLQESRHDPMSNTGEGSRENGHNYQSSRIHPSGKVKTRPTMRLGFMGIFGRKVDKIDHCREIFAALDKAVQKLRMSRVFATTSIGFVTFEEMHAAQILAQTVNTQQTLSCNTFLAPEPRDVYWDNLYLPSTELGLRSIVINVIVFCLIFFWAGPVGILSSFLSLEYLNRIFPGLTQIAKKNPLFKSLIQGFLPTVGVIIFLAIVPKILISLCRRQGIRSHSEIAQSLYSKYFAFVLVNVVLVFTILGTWAQAVTKVYHNLGELALILAASLPRVAPFFVNYTILRGIGLFPLHLLQFVDVFEQVFQGVLSKTPRDYAEARAPPQLHYGVVYSNATLVFVIILLYSCIKPMILIFGVIYFALGYLVFKYQLLYVYFHPNESGGQMWPMVYNRLTLGLVTFQVTMLGMLMLKQAFIMAILLAPLPVGTVSFWYWTTYAYKMTARYIPLELLRPIHDHNHMNDHYHGHSPPDSTPEYSSPVALGSEVGTYGQGHGEATTAMDTSSATATVIASGRDAIITPGGSKRRMPKNVVDEDDYQALPDRFTDYQQPPMTLYPGVLNSGMRHYCHPALAGPLPTLWLPLQKKEGDLSSGRGKNKKRPNVGDEEFGIGRGDHTYDFENPFDADAPRTFDEGDNLAGGGQDEDQSLSTEADVEVSCNDCTSIQIHERDGSQATGAETPGMDDDASSSITGGPSTPGSPSEDPVPSSTTSRRNPAVDGINEVYYHHPERRRLLGRFSRQGGGGGGGGGGSSKGGFFGRIRRMGTKRNLLKDS
ncbi:hypothetical protein BGZ50_004555 [Haplosporangium sp. Z 11]|nr:hypothetical protein BGZ50_004555 [Haplosporangium sp. Z 11]